VDRILDFSDISPKEKLLIDEYSYLMNLLKKIGKDISMERERLDAIMIELEELAEIVEKFTGNDKKDTTSDYDLYMKMAKSKIDYLNLLLAQLDYPYFGKIIFKRKRSDVLPEAEIPSYIGRFAYFDDKTNKPLIMDWRAPIANLYYNYSGPTKSVSIKSPIGEQTGELKQKIQFDITEGRIRNIYDIKTGNTSADEFLLLQLKRKIGKKLTDIVSTIQRQQNEIIREKNNKTVIIQGVAGSGKTTILLHRVAYLLFNYKEELRPENCMIIGPNKMFIDYISDVLPSLGVHYILKNTFLLWAKSILDWDENYKLSGEPDDLEIKEFKGSKKYIEIISDFFEDYVDDLFDKLPDKEKDKIQARFNELRKDNPAISLKEGIMLASEYVFTRNQLRRATVGSFMGDVEENTSRLRIIKTYLNKRFDPLKLYREFFKFEYIFERHNIDKVFARRLRNFSLKTLKIVGKEKLYKIEDLAPILFLHLKINGIEKKYDYIAVDEAQDMSVFQHLTLYMSAKSKNINFAGDLAQSIIPPFYIKDWQDLIDVIGEKVKLYQIDKCYRTTVEIVEFASNIFKKYFPKSFEPPKAVLRHGDDVKIMKTQNIAEMIPIISEEFDTKNISTFAILCRDYKHADRIYAELSEKAKSLNFKITNYDEDNYSDGLLVMPIDRAKGLEFDSILIADLNDTNYPDEILSAKLLYVAITRALHRVYITTDDTNNRFLS